MVVVAERGYFSQLIVCSHSICNPVILRDFVVSLSYVCFFVCLFVCLAALLGSSGSCLWDDTRFFVYFVLVFFGFFVSLFQDGRGLRSVSSS